MGGGWVTMEIERSSLFQHSAQLHQPGSHHGEIGKHVTRRDEPFKRK